MQCGDKPHLPGGASVYLFFEFTIVVLSEWQVLPLFLDINFALVYPFETYNSIEKSLVDCKPTGCNGLVSQICMNLDERRWRQSPLFAYDLGGK